ncbi:MAG: hypothetical protein ACKOF9_12370 [Burkholderiales bacterium]
MEYKLVGKTGAVLGFRTSLDLYEKLKREGARLEGRWHPDDAFNFLVTAWHLYEDWLTKDRATQPELQLASQKRRKKQLPEQMVFLLAVLRDLANGSKHLELDPKSTQNRVITETHDGGIDDYWAYFFQEGIVGVIAYDVSGDVYYFSIRTLRNLVLEYFAWVFDDAQPVASFPGQLTYKIWRCAPKSNEPGAIPPRGSIVDDSVNDGFVRDDAPSENLI